MKEKMWAVSRFFTTPPEDILVMKEDRRKTKTAPAGARKGFWRQGRSNLLVFHYG